MTEVPTYGEIIKGMPLVQYGLYNHLGHVMIAMNETEMVLVTNTDSIRHIANEQTELLARPGSDDWITRMVQIRISLARDLANERSALADTRVHLINLGEAILAKAVKHDWCEEYDEFAEEWDLPTRFFEYDVTVTVRVRAKNDDDAEEYVAENLSIDHYSENVISGPEFSVDKAY